MRQVHWQEFLDGQTLEGPAHQSYFGECSMVGATLIGDWQGTDFIACDLTGADMGQMESYACHWSDDCILTNAVIPPDLSWIAYHKPIAEVICQRKTIGLAVAPAKQKKRAERMLDEIIAWVSQPFQEGEFVSWVGAGRKIKLTGIPIATLIEMFEVIFEPWPKVLRQFRWLAETVLVGGQLPVFTTSPLSTVRWPDGVEVTVDANNLPPLAHSKDRHELARWVEEQAGPEHYAMVMTIVPMVVIILQHPDFWLSNRMSGY